MVLATVNIHWRDRETSDHLSISVRGGASQRQTFQISVVRKSGKCALTGRLRATQKFSTIQALLSPGVGISKIPCRPSGD
jgi:hypothetical protein